MWQGGRSGYQPLWEMGQDYASYALAQLPALLPNSQRVDPYQIIMPGTGAYTVISRSA